MAEKGLSDIEIKYLRQQMAASLGGGARSTKKSKRGVFEFDPEEQLTSGEYAPDLAKKAAMDARKEGKSIKESFDAYIDVAKKERLAKTGLKGETGGLLRAFGFDDLGDLYETFFEKRASDEERESAAKDIGLKLKKKKKEQQDDTPQSQAGGAGGTQQKQFREKSKKQKSPEKTKLSIIKNQSASLLGDSAEISTVGLQNLSTLIQQIQEDVDGLVEKSKPSTALTRKLAVKFSYSNKGELGLAHKDIVTLAKEITLAQQKLNKKWVDPTESSSFGKQTADAIGGMNKQMSAQLAAMNADMAKQMKDLQDQMSSIENAMLFDMLTGSRGGRAIMRSGGKLLRGAGNLIKRGYGAAKSLGSRGLAKITGRTAVTGAGAQVGAEALESAASRGAAEGAERAVVEVGDDVAKSAAKAAQEGAETGAAQAVKSASGEAGEQAAKTAAGEAGEQAAKATAKEAGEQAAKTAAGEAGEQAAKAATGEAAEKSTGFFSKIASKLGISNIGKLAAVLEMANPVVDAYTALSIQSDIATSKKAKESVAAIDSALEPYGVKVQWQDDETSYGLVPKPNKFKIGDKEYKFNELPQEYKQLYEFVQMQASGDTRSASYRNAAKYIADNRAVYDKILFAVKNKQPLPSQRTWGQLSKEIEKYVADNVKDSPERVDWAEKQYDRALSMQIARSNKSGDRTVPNLDQFIQQAKLDNIDPISRLGLAPKSDATTTAAAADQTPRTSNGTRVPEPPPGLKRAQETQQSADQSSQQPSTQESGEEVTFEQADTLAGYNLQRDYSRAYQPSTQEAGEAAKRYTLRGKTLEGKTEDILMPSESVMESIDKASKAVGVDKGIMLAMAKQESGFNPTAKAGTSSASGLYQFISATWNSMVSKYGGKYPQLLKGPFDPDASAIAGALYIKENSDILRSSGIPVNGTTIYAAHFLGPGGAKKLFKAEPTAIAASVFPQAAAANQSIFYNTDGSTKSIFDVQRVLFNKVGKYAQEYTAILEGKSMVGAERRETPTSRSRASGGGRTAPQSTQQTPTSTPTQGAGSSPSGGGGSTGPQTEPLPVTDEIEVSANKESSGKDEPLPVTDEIEVSANKESSDEDDFSDEEDDPYFDEEDDDPSYEPVADAEQLSTPATPQQQAARDRLGQRKQAARDRLGQRKQAARDRSQTRRSEYSDDPSLDQARGNFNPTPVDDMEEISVTAQKEETDDFFDQNDQEPYFDEADDAEFVDNEEPDEEMDRTTEIEAVRTQEDVFSNNSSTSADTSSSSSYNDTTENTQTETTRTGGGSKTTRLIPRHKETGRIITDEDERYELSEKGLIVNEVVNTVEAPGEESVDNQTYLKNLAAKESGEKPPAAANAVNTGTGTLSAPEPEKKTPEPPTPTGTLNNPSAPESKTQTVNVDEDKKRSERNKLVAQMVEDTPGGLTDEEVEQKIRETRPDLAQDERGRFVNAEPAKTSETVTEPTKVSETSSSSATSTSGSSSTGSVEALDEVSVSVQRKPVSTAASVAPTQNINGDEIDSGSKSVETGKAALATPEPAAPAPAPVVINNNNTQSQPASEKPDASVRTNEGSYMRSMARDFSHPSAFSNASVM